MSDYITITATPDCTGCDKPMQPTVALAFFIPQLADAPAELEWCCPQCKTLSTAPRLYPWPDGGATIPA